MSKKKKGKEKNPNAGKGLTYGIIFGMILGLIVGTILLFVFDDLFWFGITPIIGLAFGLLISPLFEKKLNVSKTTKGKTAKN